MALNGIEMGRREEVELLKSFLNIVGSSYPEGQPPLKSVMIYVLRA